MEDPRRARRGNGAEVVAQTERLERPRGARGWRLSAAAVALVLIGVVLTGRLGMEPVPAPGPTPPREAPTAVAASSPTPAAPGTPGPGRSPAPRAGSSPRPPDIGPLPIAPRYIDGIPTSIGGERVLRLGEAVALGREDSFLVGGWYSGPDCEGINGGGLCPNSRLGDNPADVRWPDGGIQLTSLVEEATGARVLRVHINWHVCGTVYCPATLAVEEVVWSGDIHTTTTPIEVVPLRSALRVAFQGYEAVPYGDLAECPVPWPPQSFRATGDGPRMVLIFPTTQDRLDAQAAIRAGRSLLLAELGGECLDVGGRSRGSGRWLARDNVMMLVPNTEPAIALAEAALTDALNDSGAQPSDAPRPITTWQAMRRLWRVEPTLDVIPSYEQTVCQPVPAEWLALRHPHIRLLAVFPSRADRRSFQRRFDRGEVPFAPPGAQCAAPGVPAVVDTRWIAFENVLLEFSGPEWLADELREALRGTDAP